MGKRIFEVRYKFNPAPDGSLYELKSAILKVKAASKAKAMEAGYRWLDNCWAFYKATCRELKKAPAPTDKGTRGEI